jgi:hypothetical protein
VWSGGNRWTVVIQPRISFFDINIAPSDCI